MANSVSVSAVPFNPQTQPFGSTPTSNMGTVNVNTPQVIQQQGVPTAAQNLANYQQQVNPITPSVVPKTQAISTFNTQPIQFPQEPTQSSYTTSNYPQSYLNAQPTAQQQQDQQVVDYNTNLWKTIANVVPQMSGQSQELQTQKNNLGVPQMNQQLQDLSNQVLQRSAELNQSDVSLAQGLQNIQDQAIPMQFITGQQASMQNQAQLARAVKVSNINMLNAVAQSVQGNISLAQQTAQDAVDLKYAPIKDMYNTLIAQQQAIQPLLTSAEKRISDQQSAVYELQKQMATQKATNEKNFMDMIVKAPTEYGATPEQIGKAISIYNQTGDPIQAFAGMSGADQFIQSYNISTGIRNYNNSGLGQPTIESGFTLNDFKKGISTIESSNNYKAIGPATSTGDKAYGKYQVMGANIPSWTKAATGTAMTAQQFLNSPDAQEKVFEKQSLDNYAKYGNWDDVASVWFSGKPVANNNRSDGSNTVPQYLQKYRQAMGVPVTSNTVISPSVITYAKDVAVNPDNMKYVPKALIPAVLAYNQENPAASNQAVTKEEQAKFLIDTIAKAEALSGASGRGGARKLIESWTVGSTDYTNLQAQIRTVKTNLLTLATDPNIKKFFGPQMTEADVRNMQAAASTLDPELQDPSSMQAELLRAKTIFQKFVPGYEAPLPLTSWGAQQNIIYNNAGSTSSYGYQ